MKACANTPPDWSRQSSIPCIFQAQDVFQLTPETQIGLVRIVQEALANIQRHSQARNVILKLISSESGLVQLNIEDWLPPTGSLLFQLKTEVILKDIEPVGLSEAVRKAAQGEVPLHSRIAAKMIQLLQQPAPGSTDEAFKGLADLSKRELEVLELIATGLSNLDIGNRLFKYLSISLLRNGIL